MRKLECTLYVSAFPIRPFVLSERLKSHQIVHRQKSPRPRHENQKKETLDEKWQCLIFKTSIAHPQWLQDSDPFPTSETQHSGNSSYDLPTRAGEKDRDAGYSDRVASIRFHVLELIKGLGILNKGSPWRSHQLMNMIHSPIGTLKSLGAALFSYLKRK